jgi:sporulation protein YlmC with PRC-barrel domain
MNDGNYNAALDLLDLELFDAHGRHCGRVDDLELEGEPGQELVVAAILSGPGTWRTRLPRRLHRLARGDAVRIPWSEILEIGPQIRLKDTDREYGLNRGEEAPSRWASRVPRS